MKNFTLPAIHLAAIFLHAPEFPANITRSFDTLFLRGSQDPP